VFMVDADYKHPSIKITITIMEKQYSNKQRYSLFFEEQERQMKAFYAQLNPHTEPVVIQGDDEDTYELKRELEGLEFNNFMNSFWEGNN
jgi:hypothetical protein